MVASKREIRRVRQPRAPRVPISAPPRENCKAAGMARSALVPRTPNRNETAQKQVVIVAHQPSLDAVRSTLRPLKVAIEAARTAPQALALARWNTAAFVTAPPFPGQKNARVCQRLRNGLKDRPVPIFALQLEGGTLAETRALYRNGATTVFDWPAEGELLLHALGRLVGLFAGKVPDDRELSRRVRARLREEAPILGDQLTVLACRATVVVGGHVDALWKVRRARQLASSVAGVRDVVTTAVDVCPAAISDRKVGAAIRSVLRNTLPDEHARSIAVSVDGGTVTVAGSVEDKSEMLRALDLIEHVRGVRRLSNMLTVAPGAARSDRKISKIVASAVADEVPQADISVSSFGGAVVLRGEVNRAADVGRIKKAAIRYPGVDRIISKIRVAHI